MTYLVLICLTIKHWSLPNPNVYGLDLQWQSSFELSSDMLHLSCLHEGASGEPPPAWVNFIMRHSNRHQSAQTSAWVRWRYNLLVLSNGWTARWRLHVTERNAGFGWEASGVLEHQIIFSGVHSVITISFLSLVISNFQERDKLKSGNRIPFFFFSFAVHVSFIPSCLW